MTKLLAPSILSADFAMLKDDIAKVEEGGADWIHCDIMDGLFVPNISFGPFIVKQVKKLTSLPLDVHLMIQNPDNYIDEFASAGADYITVHSEASVHLHRTLTKIKETGKKPGLAVNPATALSAITEALEYVDLVLIMSVNPGFGGQKFIQSSLRKIKELDQIRKDRDLDFLIETDGGLNLNNIGDVLDSGCDVIVAGSAIFNSEDVVKETQNFKKRMHY